MVIQSDHVRFAISSDSEILFKGWLPGLLLSILDGSAMFFPILLHSSNRMRQRKVPVENILLGPALAGPSDIANSGVLLP